MDSVSPIRPTEYRLGIGSNRVQSMTNRIIAGLDLAGATLTPHDDLPRGSGLLGDAIFGPPQLLRDLELRLGRGAAPEAGSLRAARWAARMTKLAPRGRFYSESFAGD